MGVLGLAAARSEGSREDAGLVGQLLAHVRVPLHRDGYALALNSAFTAAMGLGYWIVAAQNYSTHAVGLNSALISSMMFLAALAGLNLPNILVRFLPQSGDRTRRRVIVAYSVSVGLAAGAAVVFIAGVGGLAPRLSVVGSDSRLASWFLLSTLCWCLFVLQDSVLIALGRAVLVPVENAVFAVLKLVLLVGLVSLSPRYGVFVSWTCGMLVSVIGVNALLFARLLRTRAAARPAAPLSIRDRAFARYFAADYACSMAYLSTVNLLPVIITAVAGATVNAYWALAYAVAMPFYLFGQNIGTSLILHGTNAPDELPALTRAAARQGLRVLVPCVALVVMAAPVVLSLFGSRYAHHSTTLLRLLMLGALPNFILSLAVSVARVRRRLRKAVVALTAEAVVTLGLAAPALHAFGVGGVGLAWLMVQSVVASALILIWRRGEAESPVPMHLDPERVAPAVSEPATVTERQDSWSASPLPAGSDARGFRHTLKIPARDRLAGGLHPVLERLFSGLSAAGLRWTLLRVPSDPAAPTGDVDLLIHPDDAVGLRSAALNAGFAPLPGWESAPDLIFTRFDRASNRWLVLDVSTRVSFRSPAGWELSDVAPGVLARSRPDGAAVVPDPADAFWMLLLHCLLDKETVSARHQADLRRLAVDAVRSPLGAALSAATGGGITSVSIVRDVRLRQWQALAVTGTWLRQELRRRRTPSDRIRVGWRGTRRAARKPLLLRRRRGLSLALLGPNGVGKSTAATNLQESFPFETRIVYMGIWKGPERGSVSAAAEILTRPLRIWTRFLVAQYHQLHGRLVVFDRYVYEARLPARPPLLALKRPYFWLLSHAVPAASVVAVLDVPGAVAYERKQENPPAELEHERRLYARIAARVRTATMIDADVDATRVVAELNELLWQRLSSRWGAA